MIYRNQEFRHPQETETKEDEKGNESLTELVNSKVLIEHTIGLNSSVLEWGFIR